MQRALARAHQRLQGNHPRRPPAPFARTTEILCDILLAASAVAFLAGVGLTVWAIVGRLGLVQLCSGLALLAIGPVLLLIWERVAWEPFGRRLSQLS
jgi:hypothetical protein